MQALRKTFLTFNSQRFIGSKLLSNQIQFSFAKKGGAGGPPPGKSGDKKPEKKPAEKKVKY